MRVVILGSGRGSNAEAILQAQQTGKLGRAKVVQIFSDKPDAGILALGPRFNVPAQFVDPAPFKSWLLPLLPRIPRVLRAPALAAATLLAIPIDLPFGRIALGHSWHAVFVLRRAGGQS